MNAALKATLVHSGFAIGSNVAPALAARVAKELFLRPTRHQRPKWEQEILATADAHLNLDGLHVWRWDGGPQVLLVHGWAGRGSQMGAFVEPLRKMGFGVTLFDGPAHGESGGVKTNLREFSETLLKLDSQFGPFAGVVGHSFGGVATVLALSHGLRAKKVSVIGMPADMTRVMKFFWGRIGLSKRASQIFQSSLEREVGLTVDNVSPVKLVRGLDVPALVIHDRHDRDVPFKNAEEVAEHWPKSTLATKEGLGHYRILKSKEIAEEVGAFFLEAPAPGGGT